jgi:hypothetical protein
MKSLRILSVFLLASAAMSAAAHATCSADFMGNCSWNHASTADCSFSGFYDCGNALSSGYSWTTEDGGGGSGLVLNNHIFYNPGSYGAYQVTFSVTCSDNCHASATRYVCFTLGTYNCIVPDQGWN